MDAWRVDSDKADVRPLWPAARRDGDVPPAPVRHGPRDAGRTGFALVVAALVAALAVALVRWSSRLTLAGPSWERPAASPWLLWGATAILAALLLVGFALCLAGMFRAERSEGRARAGAVLGVVLAGAIALYALAGGFAAIDLGPVRGPRSVAVEPGRPVQGTEPTVIDEYEFRGLTLRRYTYDDYRFSVDVPAAPYRLRGDDLAGWEFAVRAVIDVPGVQDDALLEVYAEPRTDDAGTQGAIAAFLAEAESYYHPEDVIVSAQPGSLGGRPCAEVKSRYAGELSPEPVVTRAFWVPGDGFVYNVRCAVFEDDWQRARTTMTEIARRFRCW